MFSGSKLGKRETSVASINSKRDPLSVCGTKTSWPETLLLLVKIVLGESMSVSELRSFSAWGSGGSDTSKPSVARPSPSWIDCPCVVDIVSSLSLSSEDGVDSWTSYPAEREATKTKMPNMSPIVETIIFPLFCLDFTRQKVGIVIPAWANDPKSSPPTTVTLSIAGKIICQKP